MKLTKEELYNTSIECPSQDIFKKVEAKLIDLGFKWYSSNSYKDDHNWINVHPDKDLTSGNGKFFNKKLSYKDILGDEFKVGDKVKLINTKTAYVSSLDGTLSSTTVLNLNQEYIIVEIKTFKDRTVILIKNMHLLKYNPDCFELVKDDEPIELVKEPINTAINTTTQEEYDHVMQVFEKKGWVWCTDKKPTERNVWKYYKENTCVDYKNRFEHMPKVYYKLYGCNIISYEEFLKREGVMFSVYEVSGLRKLTSTMKSNKQNEVKQMEIKNISKKNLDTAKAKVEEERNNAEVEFATGEYRRITDEIDTCERHIKEWTDKKKEYEKELKIFKGK